MTLGAMLAGCHLVAGLDDDYRSVVPEGWQGPVQVFESGQKPQDCPSGTRELDEAYRDLVTPATSCSCATTAKACEPRLQHWQDTAIAQECLRWPPDGDVFLPTGTCVAVSMVDTYLRITTEPLDTVPCENDSALDPPLWTTSARFCSARPTLPGVCILRVGQHDCPAGSFNERRVYFGGYDDQRGCDCGHTLGQCNGALGIVDAKDFPDPLAACQGKFVSSQATFDACAGPVDARYLRFDGVATGLSCSGGTTKAPTGGVTPIDPITVCCQN
jgi:hypothetical protein